MAIKQKKETGVPICKLEPNELVLTGHYKYINPKRLLKNAPASALIQKKSLKTKSNDSIDCFSLVWYLNFCTTLRVGNYNPQLFLY
jgi:hypothetical protein